MSVTSTITSQSVAVNSQTPNNSIGSSSSPIRNKPSSSYLMMSSSPEAKLMSFHNRLQGDSYSQLSIDIIQMEVMHGALDVIQPMNCEVILDHQKCNFLSQTGKFTYNEKVVIIPFHKKLNIVSDDDTDDMTIVIKLSYSNGNIIGMFVSQLKALIKVKDLQDIVIVGKDSRPIGQLKVMFTRSSEGYFEDSCSETSSQQSITPQSTTSTISPIPRPFPRVDEAKALSIARVMPLKRVIESPILNTHIIHPSPATNIRKDFEEEDDSVDIINPIPSSPAKISSIDTIEPTPETEIPSNMLLLSKIETSSGDKHISDSLKTTDDKRTDKKFVWTSFFMGGGCVLAIIVMVMMIKYSFTSISRNTLITIETEVDTEIKSVKQASYRKKLVIASSGLSIELIGMNQGTDNENHAKLYWKRGIFGNIDIFNELLNGHAKVIHDPTLSSWWTVLMNPSKKIQLQHHKSGKCLCPSSSSSSKSVPKKLTIKSCDKCDAGYGWSIEGTDNRLKYSSGSSDDYCVMKSAKNHLMIDLCSSNAEFIKFSISTHTIIQIPQLLSSTGMNSEPYQFSKEVFTDMNVA